MYARASSEISKTTPLEEEKVQKKIDVNLEGSLEQKAKKVIRGDFGNGIERKNKLGSEYDVIQSKVNEMYRKGDMYM